MTGQQSVFNATAVRQVSGRRLWWHRLISVGRRHQSFEIGFAITWYRNRRGVNVILESQETEDSPFRTDKEGG